MESSGLHFEMPGWWLHGGVASSRGDYDLVQLWS